MLQYCGGGVWVEMRVESVHGDNQVCDTEYASHCRNTHCFTHWHIVHTPRLMRYMTWVFIAASVVVCLELCIVEARFGGNQFCCTCCSQMLLHFFVVNVALDADKYRWYLRLLQSNAACCSQMLQQCCNCCNLMPPCRNSFVALVPVTLQPANTGDHLVPKMIVVRMR